MKDSLSAAVYFVLLLVAPSSAFAYLDPGTGSIIFQGILGALATAVVVLRLYWHRFLSILGIRRSTKKEEEGGSAAE